MDEISSAPLDAFTTPIWTNLPLDLPYLWKQCKFAQLLREPIINLT